MFLNLHHVKYFKMFCAENNGHTHLLGISLFFGVDGLSHSDLVNNKCGDQKKVRCSQTFGGLCPADAQQKIANNINFEPAEEAVCLALT